MEVEIVDVSGVFVYWCEDLDVVMWVELCVVVWDEFGVECDGFGEVVVGGVGDDEGEIVLCLYGGEFGGVWWKCGVVVVDCVGGGDDLVLVFLVVDDVEVGYGEWCCW